MSFSTSLQWRIPGITLGAKSLRRPASLSTQLLCFGFIFCMPFIYPFLKSGFFRVQRAISSTCITMAEVTAQPKEGDSGVYSIVYVSAPSEEVAKTISKGLVGEKLAACVNIIPKIISIYEWKGELNEDNEVLMMIKTRTSRIEELAEFVRKNHPYEVCEVIATKISHGNQPYLDWIGGIVSQAKQ